MKALATIMGILAPVTAFAASGAADEGGGIFGWIFLGFVAMILVSQTVPAILLFSGMAKGVVSMMKDRKSTVNK